MSHARSQQEGDIPEFHIDWCFPGDEQAGNTLNVLVCRMRNVRMTMSSVAPSKSTGEFIARRLMAFLRECGCEAGDVVIKSDQEPAIELLLKEITEARGCKEVGFRG